jgi:hypothetical protein
VWGGGGGGVELDEGSRIKEGKLFL